MSDTLTYTQAFQELQLLVNEIENGDISVDELSSKVKRAVSLIQVCRMKLTATESEVNSILAQLNTLTEPGDRAAGEENENGAGNS